MKIPYLTRFDRQIDLAALQPEDINWQDVAERLASMPRFNKGHFGPPYSVAQHCVMGADAMWRETENATLAAQFLLHDAHEAFLGDITSPVAKMLAESVKTIAGEASICGEAHCKFAAWSPSAGETVMGGIEVMKQTVDAAIFARAGVPFWGEDPMPSRVEAMDKRMLHAEAEFLFGRLAVRDWPVKRRPALAGPLKQWPWPKAADEWLERFGRYCGDAAAMARVMGEA